MKYSNSYCFTFEELMGFVRNVQAISPVKSSDENLASIIKVILEGNIEVAQKPYRRPE